MTSPREQAIEEAAKAIMERTMSPDAKTDSKSVEAWMETTFRPDAVAAITAYESARARIDGAKMMSREATEEMVAAGVTAYELTGIAAGIISTAEQHVSFIHRAMHDATPKEKD